MQNQSRSSSLWSGTNVPSTMLKCFGSAHSKREPPHRFSDWPSLVVPRVAAGVYTIWDHDRFIYVGMAGRGLSAEDIDAPDEPVKAKGLLSRLHSHATGRRSGDQFCVYVCDRFIVPHLTGEQQSQLADGDLSLDALTRHLMHEHYEYRIVTTPDGAEALGWNAKYSVARWPLVSPS